MGIGIPDGATGAHCLDTMGTMATDTIKSTGAGPGPWGGSCDMKFTHVCIYVRTRLAHGTGNF